MANKQTAVEYLVKEFSAILGPIKTEPMQDLLLADAMKKANQMEKEQHSETWIGSRMSNYIGLQKSFEEYYNENYGK